MKRLHLLAGAAAATAAAVTAATLTAHDWTPGEPERGTVAAVAPLTAGRTPAIVGAVYHPSWTATYPDAASRARTLDALAAAGVDSVRMDVSWTQLEKTGDNQYSQAAVAAMDTYTSEIAARGMTFTAMVWSAPTWASGADDPAYPGFGRQGEALTAPGAAEAYGDFLGWAAKRWPAAAAWEMWNEPDHAEFWSDTRDPSRTSTPAGRAATYAQAAVRAYDVAHAKAPTATFLLAGPAGLGLADGWFNNLYSAQVTDTAGRPATVAGHHDGIAVHPYVQPTDRDPATLPASDDWSAAGLSRVYDLMVSRGDTAKKLWATEYGSSTHWNQLTEGNWQRGVDPRQQAKHLIGELDVLASLTSRDGSPLVRGAYAYTDRDYPGADAQPANYGLLDSTWAAKPALDALACAAAGPPGALCGTRVAPETYGAAGNAIADDTAALRSAITAAGPGGTVTLAPGRTYRITGPLDLTTARTSLSADAGRATITGADITLTGAYTSTAGVDLRNASITARGKGAVIADTTITTGRLTVDGPGITVRRTTVTSAPGDAITATSAADGTTLNQVEAVNAAGSGIAVRTARRTTVDAATITSPGAAGITASDAATLIVSAATITRPGTDGITVTAAGTAAATARIMSATVDTPTGVGLRIASSSTTSAAVTVDTATVTSPGSGAAADITRTPSAAPLNITITALNHNAATFARMAVDAAEDYPLPAGEVHPPGAGALLRSNPPVAGLPGAPTAVAVARTTNTSADLTFTAPPGVSVHSYEYSLDGGTTWRTPTITTIDPAANPNSAAVQQNSSPITVTNLPAGATTPITVRTVTLQGRSAPTAAVQATTRTPGDMPAAGSVTVIAAGAAQRTGAALGNLTLTGATSPGWATAYPCAVGRAGTSNQYARIDRTTSALAAARADADGNLCVYTTAATHLLWDQSVDDAAGSPTARRLADTRTVGGTRAAGTVLTVDTGITTGTLVGTLSAIGPQTPGWLTAYPCNAARPTASNINYPAGTDTAAGFFAAASPDGKLCIYTSGATNILVDLGAATPTASHPATRLVDTRTTGAGPLAAGTTLEVPTPAAAGATVLATVTAVNPSAAGWATVWPCGTARPTASNISFGAGITTANAVATAAGTAGKVCIYSPVTTDILLDSVTETGPGAHSPTRMLDTRLR